MKFYGTSAAEAIPNPFCDCFLCNHARKAGGKDIRTRSMFRLSEQIAIDLGADSLMQAIAYGDFRNLEHVLITHSHEDHFAYMMMGVRKMATHRKETPLILTDKAYDIIDFYRNNTPILKGSVKELEENNIIQFKKLEFYQEYQVGNVKVIPFKGNHFGNMDENAANYLITMDDGKILFYGLDTGYYLEETFEKLKNYKFDYFISECTFGNAPDRPEKPHGHLDIPSCMLVFKRLLEQGTINENTKIYLTHINHCHTATHQDMVDYFTKTDFPCEIQVAYDGMEI